MGLDLDDINGGTLPDEDEKEGLRIKTITTRQELDEFEQQNIEKAMLWIRKKKFSTREILSEKFVKELHRRMYADVWKWAGEFRKTNKNIGVDKHQVAVALKQLLDDGLHWIEHHSFPDAEIAIRIKHRIVQVHCFANGNGRHSRLMADIIMEKIFHQPPFTWGAANLIKKGDPRSAYLHALKKADAGDYKDLIKFARS
jgi:Fic-DOC domain mobile mystery protein B